MLETAEWILLKRQVGHDDADEFGFLTEIPFLKSVAPQIQLDALAETWTRISRGAGINADIMDECVIYAVCETVARMVYEYPTDVERLLENGPQRVEIAVDRSLVPKLRALHLNLPIDGDFLLASQFEDMDPSEAERYKRKFRIDSTRLDILLDSLGRWHVSEAFSENVQYLLTDRETERVDRLVREHPSLDRRKQTGSEKGP